MANLPVRYNSILGTYEVKLKLEARIIPVLEVFGDEGQAMFTRPQPITIIIKPEFIDKCADPEQIIQYVHRQVQNVWTAAVAGMASKYTDLIIEALMPTVEVLIREKDWGIK